MDSWTSPYHSQITALCEKYNVKRLWLFGSYARGEQTTDSDVDFLYELDHQRLSPKESNDQFFSLIESLEALLKRKVDFIWANGVKNPYFKKELDKEKILLYGEKS